MELTGLQVDKVNIWSLQVYRLTMSIYGVDKVDMSHISLFSPHCLYFFALNHQDMKLEAPRSLYSSPGYNNNISQ